jgi:AbiJ N-terminal domain 3/Predicted nucleotide-binding protein containing TIR-like domain
VPNSITQVTRRKIMDLFLTLGYNWSGRLDEVAFLARIYDLNKMPSTDSRYKNAYGDIHQHRVNNADWTDDYPFVDSRFNLLHGSDADLLRFLTETLHPVVRESEEAAQMVERLNKVLRPDGFEFVPVDEISGEPVYGTARTSNQGRSGLIDQHGSAPLFDPYEPVQTTSPQRASNHVHADYNSSGPGGDHSISQAVSLPGGLPEKAVIAPSSGAVPQTKRIFVVHGHNESAKDSVHLFLNQLTSKDAIILHEQGNRSQSLIEKLEAASDTASYAVILLTADDVGKAKNDTDVVPRGRQNVVFEMGYFMGKLGRKNVAVLMENGVEEPGDIRGMLYIPFDAFGTWKNKLAGEIKNAGHEVDLNILTK